MHYLIAICLLVTATAGIYGNPVQRWWPQVKLPPWQQVDADQDWEDDEQQGFGVNPDCGKTTTYQRSVVYVLETKQVMVVPSGGVPSGALVTTTTPAPEDTTDVPPPQKLINPPPGYTYLPETGSMYNFHVNGAPWDDAEATCQREGGHLMVIDNEVEAIAVVNLLKKAGYKYTWVGLRDRRPGGVIDWRTIGGESLSTVYNRWTEGRPYKTGDWTCGYFYDDQILYDSPCHVANYFTCEITLDDFFL